MKLKLKTKKAIKEYSEDARKIIFSHRRALGDGLMFTAGVRDFCLLFPEIRVNVDSNQPALWENNPYIDRTLTYNEEGVEFYRVGYPAIGSCNNTNLHFTQMFLLDMIANVDEHKSLPIPLWEFCAAFSNGAVGDPNLGSLEKNPEGAREPFISMREKYDNFGKTFSRMYGDIHLTEEEKTRKIIDGQYWVIAPGGKRDGTTKIWDWRRFKDVVDYFEGKLKFVSIGKSDLLVEKIPGVISMVDKFNDDIRGLLSLVHNADGCVSGPSFLNHLAAALPPKIGNARKPCVSIWGGREPAGWCWYTNHQILHTNGVFSCCDTGGCWKARTYPLQKDKKHNDSLCKKPIQVGGRTIQQCMDLITSKDVIRAIERYYEGDLYKITLPGAHGSGNMRKKQSPRTLLGHKALLTTTTENRKEIALWGNLNSKGGGEQSLCKIAEVLQDAGWKVHLHPWSTVHEKYSGNGLPIEEGPPKSGIPLLYYANDTTREFTEKAEKIVEQSAGLIIGINYINSPLTKCNWLGKTDKLKAIVFQNQEKKKEFDRDAIGFEDVERHTLFGAIDLERFLEVCPPERKKEERLVVLKHCVPDYRKYVTEESKGKGEKIHVWQKGLDKEKDIKFYKRLLKDVGNIQFEFMEAHEELRKNFKGEERMVFHEFDSISVEEFLGRGHIYLYRTSNMWRDNYPRVVAEALAAGLPVLSEPRDGTADRIVHGDTGFYCVDYDGYKYALRMLMRKEKYRHQMGMYAKDWARENLDPRKWGDIIAKFFS